MNKLEKFLFCHAYPGIDPNTVNVVYFKSGEGKPARSLKFTDAFDGKSGELSRFYWTKYHTKDHATYVHYASIVFYYKPETNTLFIRENSLKHGNQLVSFELSEDFINAPR